MALDAPGRTEAGRPPRLLAWAGEVASRAARKAPLSLSFLVVFWVVGAGTGSVPGGPHGRLGTSTLFEGAASLGHPLSFALSLLWASGVGGYLGGTLALLTLGLFAEQRLGTGRYAVAVVAAHVFAALTLALSASFLGHLYPLWTQESLFVRYGGPTLGLVGAVLAASCSLPTLWRRRLRVGSLALLGTMVLFYGGGVAVLLLVAAVIGLGTGPLLHRAQTRLQPVGSIHEARVLAALVVAATALGPLLAAITPAPTGPFAVLGYLVAPVRGARPEVVAQICAEAPASAGCTIGQLHVHPSVGVTVMACLPALLLLVFADGLRRGRRTAWAGALVLEAALAAVAVANYFRTLADAGTVLPNASLSDEAPVSLLTELVLPCLVPVTVTVLVLILGRNLFTVQESRRERRGICGRLGLLALAGAGLYVGVGLVVAGQWRTPPTVWSLVTDLPLRLAPLDLTLGVLPQQLPAGPVARVLFEWVGVLFWAPAAAMVLRAFRRDPSASGSDTDRARRILLEHGGSSIAWMGLWPGNTYWFSPGGASYVAYRVIGGVALTTGDPVGPDADRGSQVQQFTSYCESMGWNPCFYSATVRLQALCAVQGWGSAQIAEEAVLHLGPLAFTGKRFQDVRTALNRAKREGVRTEWIDYRTAALATVLQIRAISEDWVAEQALPEMGFTLGGLEQLADPAVRCSVVVDETGRVHAAASWLPIHDGGRVTGWTLDFMRQRSDGFRHGVELLIAQAALDFKDQGYAVLSLSAAPLARTPRPASATGCPRVRPRGADALERLLDLLGTRLEPLYGFRSLLRFKAKFGPDYQPLYLLYADAAALPAIGRAVAKAYLPDASLGLLLGLVNRLTLARRSGDRGRPRTQPSSAASRRGPGRHHRDDRGQAPDGVEAVPRARTRATR